MILVMLMKRIVGSIVRGVMLRGRPQTGWMDILKRALNERGMSVEQGRMIVCDRSKYRAVVNAWLMKQL